MILCGIVLYNPEVDRLKRNIDSVIKQVDYVLIVDNCSNNKMEIKNTLDFFEEKVQYIRYEKNLGIAAALNTIIDYAKNNSYKWVLTMDQDSIANENMVGTMLKYSSIESIGILCPLNIDKNGYSADGETCGIKDMEWCITSGSLININECSKNCSFDEKMFIDLVDYDYSLQVKKQGLRIVRIYDAILYHRLGDLKTISFFNKKMEITNHSALRRYYYVRNIYYLFKKYNFNSKERRKWKKKILSIKLKILLFEKNKFSKLKMIHKGRIDSKEM